MRGGDRLGAAAVGAGLTSLAVDAAVLIRGTPYPQGVTLASGQGAAEVLVLLVLLVLAVRRARRGVAIAAGAAAGLAVPLWLLRFGPPDRSPESVGGYAAWGMLALLAVGVGLYLRALDERRTRAVTAARREQRLSLADDLHDFVVHDINEMLLQAQAGRVLLRAGTAGAATTGVDDVLRRIEGAAARALETVDRTVHVLHHEVDSDGASRSPQPMLGELPALVERFAATGPATARLELDPDLTPDGEAALPPEVATTVYRIVVEALTNVRRHAVDAWDVRVTVGRTPGGDVRAEVVDDGRGRRSARSAGRATGGLGLAGLAERIGALGGTLEAGPAEPTGWRVTAMLPARARRDADDPLGR